MRKPADTKYEIQDLIRERWSPRAFSSDVIEDEDLGSLLEAARWAPSCFNEQPWRFIVARRQDDAEFAKMLSCFSPFNQEWAQHAGLLLLTVASRFFAHNQKENRHAWHDVGLATAQLFLQAKALGLASHALAGFDEKIARALYGIPEDFEPVTALVIGYPGNFTELSEKNQEKELAPRQRRGLHEIVFAGEWGATPGTFDAD